MNPQLLNQLNDQLSRAGSVARRLLHGRGRSFEGLEHINIEWYPPFVFVQNFSEDLSPAIAGTLSSFFESNPQIEAILVQSRRWPDFETEVILARQPVELPLKQWTALSADILCETSLGKNRNTGVFLDMRAGWDWVQDNARDKNILNLFSYTGVFSLFALHGGARKVDNVDMAANVLKIAQRNHQKNDLHDGRCAFYKRDILKSDRWLENRPPYDLIILDPPPYQKKAFRGWSDYRKLLQTCKAALAPQGQLFVCLNNPQVTLQEFQADLAQLFPESERIEQVERASEISERDNSKGLKTLAIQF